MTLYEFINSQIAINGTDYVDNMFDRNFVPVCTDHGWRWLYVSNDDYAEWVDTNLSAANSVLESR